tara:strand:+ start:397 stop:585 length:189 start_codon:yes stop_codon:yes gene_type:complete
MNTYSFRLTSSVNIDAPAGTDPSALIAQALSEFADELKTGWASVHCFQITHADGQIFEYEED